jgi:lipopolysaccharide export LptBFGC system permease protein LptF
MADHYGITEKIALKSPRTYGLLFLAMAAIAVVLGLVDVRRFAFIVVLCGILAVVMASLFIASRRQVHRVNT